MDKWRTLFRTFATFVRACDFHGPPLFDPAGMGTDASLTSNARLDVVTLLANTTDEFGTPGVDL